MSDSIHNNTEPIYTLGVASKLTKIPQHSIRQYIDKGLIIPFKTETNRHLFSEIDIHRLLWLKGKLDDKGLNFAGIKALYALIPCWKIRPCDTETRNNCEAYNSSDYPCWQASNKGPECKNMDCRVCNVYQISGNGKEIKSIFREILR